MLLQPLMGFGCQNHVFLTQKKTPIQQHSTNNQYSNIVFLSSTSAGQPIRKLREVPCAFFDVITINSSDMDKIKKGLLSCTTVKKAVQYLKKYKEKNMLPTEKAIFERFEEAAKNSPRTQFQDLLKKWYDEALIKLKLEEFAVIDEIDGISLKLSPESIFNVRKETTNCRKIIIDNDPGNIFKRKTVLNSLRRIEIKPGEEKIMEELMDKAEYLPTSATSENAFIVKYANRSHNEISNRLITQSLLTIDHALAQSKGGENEIGNFLGTSAGANSLKGDMPLKKFIKRFPQAIKNCQRYIDFFIDLINNGGLKGNQSYPYKIKRRLASESNNKIKLDLSLFKYTKEEAKELEKETKRKHKKS